MHVAAMGKLELVGDETLQQQQPLALLCYLSLEGPKTRRHLATVFWPEAKRPLNNLSSALTRIRDRFPVAITSDDNRILSTVTTDVAVLTQAIECLDVATILDVYRGHFFEAAEIRTMGLELEEWVYSRRDALALAASEALLSAAEDGSVADIADTESSVKLAESAYEIGRTFWTNQTLWERCHRLLVCNNNVVAERVRMDAAEVGFVLAEAAELPDDDVGQRAQTDREIHAANLFGRRTELRTVARFVDGQQTGYLSIVGMGGIGKTTLASSYLADHATREPNGLHVWVPLAELNDAGQIPQAIAASFNLDYSDEPALLASLEGIAEKQSPTVLVLDNLEHLQGFDSLLTALAAIPGLRVIVTSRVVTGLAGETILRLEGLATGPREHDAAMAMFIARSQLVCPEVVDEPDLASRVCELVDGLPLAIELSAGWLRSMPLPVLVESLSASSELLAASPSGEIESMQAVLGRSWALLPESDALVLNKLALFEGSFSFDEAISISGASLTTITRLIDRSLVARSGERLELHSLVRSYAREALDEPAREVATRRLIEHYRKKLVDAGIEMRRSGATTASRRLAETLPNIEAAWGAALSTGTWGAVADMADGLDQHLRNQSRQFVAARLFEQALDVLEPIAHGSPGGSVERRAYVAVGWRYAFTRMQQGSMDDTERSLAKCLELCDEDDLVGRIGIAYTHGHQAIFLGEYQQAESHLEAAQALADDSIEDWLLGAINSGIGLATMSLGEMSKARAALRSVLDTGRRLGNPVTVTSAYYLLGSLEMGTDPELALVLLEEGRETAEQASLTHMLRKLATLIGRGHVEQGDYESAIAVFEEAVQDAADESQTVKEPWVLVSNQTGLGMAFALAGEHERAAEWFTRAVRAEVALGDWPLLMETVLQICRMRIDAADLDQWRDLLTSLAADPATMWGWRVDAYELLDEAGVERPAIDLTDEAASGDAAAPSVRLDVVAEQALALLRSPQRAVVRSS